MNNKALEYTSLFKIVIYGPSGVGKTLMLRRYADDQYSEAYICTIGVDFKIKNVIYKNELYKLQIWDTAGQERFRCITNSYLRNASGLLLCYDISNEQSFQDMIRTYDEVINQCTQAQIPIPAIQVCGLKSDLADKRQVPQDLALAFSESNNLRYIENSSKDNINVDETFNLILQKMVEEKVLAQEVDQNKDQLILEKKPKNKTTCC